MSDETLGAAAKRIVRPDISVGNILTVVMIIVSAVAGWTAMRTTQDEHDRRILENKAAVAQLALETRAELADLRKERVQLLTTMSAVQTDLRHLLAEVTRLRTSLETRTNGR